MTAPRPTFRTYEAPDGEAVRHLHGVAIRETGVDPSDVPGTEDLRNVESVYLDNGGEFLVGVLPAETASVGSVADPEKVCTHDGVVVAMGGVLPNEAGHDDERDRPGAAELHRMRVAPSCQRQGYGRQLLEELEAAAVAAGFDLVLATTSTRQPAAVSFYADHGYERVGSSVEGEYELVHFEKEM